MVSRVRPHGPKVCPSIAIPGAPAPCSPLDQLPCGLVTCASGPGKNIVSSLSPDHRTIHGGAPPSPRTSTTSPSRAGWPTWADAITTRSPTDARIATSRYDSGGGSHHLHRSSHGQVFFPLDVRPGDPRSGHRGLHHFTFAVGDHRPGIGRHEHRLALGQRVRLALPGQTGSPSCTYSDE